MPLFWILAALMVAVALAFVLVPLLRARAAAGPRRDEANLAVLRGQRAEIEADVARGTLAAESRDEALAELVTRAEQDLSPEAPVAAPQSRPWPTALGVALLLPLIAFGTYLSVGMPAAIDPKQAARPQEVGDAQIVAMVESLAQKVRERPDDVRGWTLLARSMASLGRFDEAVKAYEQLAKIDARNPQVLADYADALAMTQGRKLAGKPYELAKAALAIDPKHPKALALAGTAAMDAGDFRSALAHWEALAADMPAGSEDAAQVAAIIGEVRTRAGMAPAARASGPVAVAPATRAASVSGSVAVAPEIAARIAPTDTVFVFARSEGGPRVPLAVLRANAREFPLVFALDDSMAMSPQAKLSDAKTVRIEARVSRSGNATPQPGDLVGRSAIVKPGERDVKVLVNEVLP
jgi:cytochrome c-type biogenesis protein CcmH